MELKAYFENNRGFGVLATADQQGNVDAAVYSRPHVMADGTLAFIMNDRLSHQYLQSNPHAAYLFREGSEGYQGKRFFLTKIREEQDSELLDQLKRRVYPKDKPHEGPRFLVFFKIDKELPLIGPGEETD
ncbi:pyridoxamine 5'-phosphate oxidase family protein [Desulfatitalea alkaliphila]|uniref:Pyridoxamine 5'-phosphate oxidase family protein n=1 Tax=Desulfatitalea alkaliphila TaxID=2929485 RepID=A0AA41QZL1_9BACT|nr:pyridoxamine 5'-phosphate oxidase family protein [Desulfatitalea alkaliphila]MCJ8500042.1 pyridoxamine 5'-phosphate oxidase family protein [Desulfatitalea alkaliphila]